LRSRLRSTPARTSCRTIGWASRARNRELFTLLEQNAWLAASLAQNLRDMVGFRNVLVHGYDRLNLEIVEDVLKNRLGDLDAFVAAIRARLLSA
jgi:uncharacterized protein YutE (UPF0331/DUF86 family)